MNYTEVGLDLQGVAKRIYFNLQYKSAFFKMLNPAYIQELRNVGTPSIEVVKTNSITLTPRQTVEIANALTPSSVGYTPVKVDLTELRLDYSLKIPVLITGTNFTNALQSAMEKRDSAVAKAIDTYGFGKLASDANITEKEWDPTTHQDYVDLITALTADLFNNDVYDGYTLALSATEYAKYVAALTSVLKYETMAGIEGVDRGTVARAYGVDAFQVNDTVLGSGIKGYFFNPIAVVGDTFFDKFVQFNGDYPGFPGYYVMEGNILFGAKVVEENAIFRLVDEVSA